MPKRAVFVAYPAKKIGDPAYDVDDEHLLEFARSLKGSMVTGSICGHDKIDEAIAKAEKETHPDVERFVLQYERNRLDPTNPVAGVVTRTFFDKDNSILAEVKFNGHNPLLEKLVEERVLTSCSITDRRIVKGSTAPQGKELSICADPARPGSTLLFFGDSVPDLYKNMSETPAPPPAAAPPAGEPDGNVMATFANAISSLPQDQQEKFMGIVDKLTGHQQELTAKSRAEIERLQSELKKSTQLNEMTLDQAKAYVKNALEEMGGTEEDSTEIINDIKTPQEAMIARMITTKAANMFRRQSKRDASEPAVQHSSAPPAKKSKPDEETGVASRLARFGKAFDLQI